MKLLKNICSMVTMFTMLSFISCKESDSLFSDNSDKWVTGIYATTTDVIADVDQTRALAVSPTGSLSFSWADGDVLGIYPIGGDQVAFPISDGAGTKTAKFDGGSWALRANFRYAAYYPFSADNYHIAQTEIPVSLTGQVQDGNNNLSMASSFDYQAAAAVQPNENGSVMLDFNHLCCFMKLYLTMARPGTYTHVKVTSNNTPFATKATFDLTDAAPALSATETSSSVSMYLTNFTTTSANEEVIVYNLVVPVNMVGSKLSVEVIDNAGNKYAGVAEADGKNMIAGRMCGYRFTVDATGTGGSGSDIPAEDDEETEATLIEGPKFNAAIRSLANQHTIEEFSEDFHNSDETIKKIVFEKNTSITNGISLSENNSAPIWANFDNTTGTLTISAHSDKILLSSNPSWSFYELSKMSEIQGMEMLDTQFACDMNSMFGNCSALTSLNLSAFNTQNATNMNFMFGGCSALTSLDISSFNTQNVTAMSSMFSGCSALTSLNLSSLDTQKVTDMAGLFQDCFKLTTLDLSTLNLENVQTINHMFNGCIGLKSIDLSNFDTKNVIYMSGVFQGCSSLETLNLSSFDTQKVTNMSYMFYSCSALTSLDLSSFNTQNVTDMNHMFSDCEVLIELDLSSFNTQNVTDMSYMFNWCSALIGLNLSSFNTQKVTNMSYMFIGCYKLPGLNLSSFDTQNVTNMDHMFYGCSALNRLNLSNFNLDNLTNKSNILYSVGQSTIPQSVKITCTEAVKTILADADETYCPKFVTWEIVQ